MMLRAISTYVYVRERLHPGLLDNLARGGAQAIEVHATKSHFDYASPQHIREIGAWFNGNPVSFHSMHSPMYAEDDGERGTPLNIASRDRKVCILAMDEIKRALEVAERAPFRFLVQHIGVSGEDFDEHKFDAAMTSMEHLRAFAKPLGVRLLLENIPNELSTAARLIDFIQVTHMDDVGVCYDFGHANLCGGIAASFESLKPYIRSTHVHDNQGDRDTHLWPGEGTIDWQQAMELLRGVPQAPPVLMETEGDPQGSPEFEKKVPGLMQDAYRKLGML
ncbi:MAG: sugar phosphate isomerase/epimerase family protein [Candidatus Korobacteraceae bacterium]|jgi:sugar phosphate isomerase/epimerase